MPERSRAERSRYRAAAALITVLLGATAPARAGAPEAAPRQVLLPWTLGADQAGPQAVLGHAAALGWLGRGDVFEAGLGLGASTTVTGARETDGVALAGAARLGPVALGLAYGRAGRERFRLDTNRFDVALAYRAAEWLSVGLRWAELWSEDPAGVSYASGSLSASVRPLRHLSLAIALDRFNRPFDAIRGRLDEPLWRFGLGIRPGSERVAFGLDGGVDMRERPLWYLGGSLRFMPIEGLALGGYGRYVGEPGAQDRIEWGAYLAFEQSGVQVAASLDRYDPTGTGGPDGMTASLWVETGTWRTTDLVTTGHIVPRLAIGGSIPERPGDGVLSDGRPPFAFWLAALDAMGRDRDVDAVVLDVEGAPGWGQSWELRQAIVRLRAAGRRVYVRVTGADMRTFYLASAADRIYLHPSGLVSLLGLAMTRTYYGDLLAKLGVEAQFVQYEEYKTAPETYTRSGPSERSTEQTRDLLGAFDDAWFQAAQLGRGLDRAALEAVIDSGPHTFQMAHQDRLVDRIVADEELEDAIGEDLGHPVHVTWGYRPSPRAWARWRSPRQIAILPVVGSIIDGEEYPIALPILGEQTGDRPFVQALRAAAADPAVVGIVVRVDSPGGSVTASDRMYQAVAKAAEDKPVVVSFGDVAASGGYYLACGAESILSTPLTITGSIGIFSGKVDLSGLYAMLGVGTSTQRTAPHADALGMHRPWTEQERATAHDRLGAYYDRFVGLVARARRLTPEVARQRAKGRVYLGDRAMELGLVDVRGGLWEALALVREKAGIGPSERLDLSYRPGPGLLAQLSGFFGGLVAADEPPAASVVSGGLLALVGEWLATLEHLSRGGVQARLPYHLEVR